MAENENQPAAETETPAAPAAETPSAAAAEVPATSAETAQPSQPVEEKDKSGAKPEDAAGKTDIATGESLFDATRLGILNDVAISLTIEVGKAQIKLRDLLNLSRGSVIELNKSAGDPVDVYANGKLISTGNIITANGKYCVRLVSISEHGKAEVHSDGK